MNARGPGGVAAELGALVAATLAKRTVAMSIKRRHAVRAGTLAGVFALIALGFSWPIADQHASAIAPLNAPAVACHTSQSRVPRVSVLVDGAPPLESSTGTALNPSGTTAWVTEGVASEMLNGGQQAGAAERPIEYLCEAGSRLRGI